MALGLSGPALPAATANDCLDVLAGKIAAVPGIDGCYGYRVAETKLGVTVVVTSISSVLGDAPTGLTSAYDYIVAKLVRIDGDYETAERTLNDVCDGIWRAVWGASYPVWSDCYPFAADQKPASPQELTGWRRAILYVRVIPV